MINLLSIGAKLSSTELEPAARIILLAVTALGQLSPAALLIGVISTRFGLISWACARIDLTLLSSNILALCEIQWVVEF